MTTNCLICGKALDSFNLGLNRQWHLECEACPICGQGPMDLDMIKVALDKGKPLGHTGCLEQKAMADLKNSAIPLYLEQVEFLNRAMTTQWKVEPKVEDIDNLYKMLRSLQETAANVSIILGRTKEKIMVREAQDYRTKTKEQREAEKAAIREKEQTKLAAGERQELLAKERADPALRLRRKALEGLMSTLGLSLEQAQAMIEETENRRKVQ